MHQVVRNGDHQGLLMGVCRMVGEPKSVFTISREGVQDAIGMGC